MKKPLVSVIIPTYNRLEYLMQAIESVLESELRSIRNNCR